MPIFLQLIFLKIHRLRLDKDLMTKKFF